MKTDYTDNKNIPLVNDVTSENNIGETAFVFENFIVRSTNRLAHAVSLAVAENADIVYNPLTIYGPSGVGKTHLVLAIKNRISSKYSYKKTGFISGKEITNQMIKSSNEGKCSIADILNRYRNVEVLIIDDFHLIADNQAVQKEIRNILDDLYHNNKQIIVTLDRPIEKVKTLDDRIKTCLLDGVIADIEPWDL